MDKVPVSLYLWKVDRVRIVRNLRNLLPDRELLERRLSVHHLIQDAPQGPHVAGRPDLHIRIGIITNSDALSSLSVSYVHQRLRRNVIQSTNLRVAQHTRVISRNSTRDAEVDQLQRASNKEKVGRLQVAVNDLRLVNCVHGVEHLLPQETDEVHVN